MKEPEATGNDYYREASKLVADIIQTAFTDIRQNTDVLVSSGDVTPAPTECQSNINWPSIADFTVENGLKSIDQYIKNCCELEKKWLYCIDYLGEADFDFDTRYNYRIIFSIPTKVTPIPRATANVYFTISIRKYRPKDEKVSTYFVVESNRVVHKPGQDKLNQIWLSNVIDAKIITLSEDNMSRQSVWRRGISEVGSWRQDQALHANIYIISQSGPMAFVLQEENKPKNVKVYLGDPHHCSCLDFMRDKAELCIHINWLLLKRYRLSRDDPMSWQLGLIEREVADLISGRQQQVRRVALEEEDGVTPNDIKELLGEKEAETKELTQRQIDKEDVCPICQDNFYLKHEPVTFCRFGCANAMHVKCLQVWLKHATTNQIDETTTSTTLVASCPYCRQSLGDVDALYKELHRASQLSRLLFVGCYRCGIRLDKNHADKCPSCTPKCRLPFFCENCLINHQHVNKPKTAKSTSNEFASEYPERTIPLEEFNKLSAKESLKNTAKTYKINDERSKHLARGEQCLLCFSSFKVGELVSRSTNCKHVFHQCCLLDFCREISDRCPIDQILLFTMPENTQQRPAQGPIQSGQMPFGGVFTNIGIDTMSFVSPVSQLPPTLPAGRMVSQNAVPLKGATASDRILAARQRKLRNQSQQREQQQFVMGLSVVGGRRLLHDRGDGVDSAAISPSGMHSASVHTMKGRGERRTMAARSNSVDHLAGTGPGIPRQHQQQQEVLATVHRRQHVAKRQTSSTGMTASQSGTSTGIGLNVSGATLK